MFIRASYSIPPVRKDSHGCGKTKSGGVIEEKEEKLENLNFVQVREERANLKSERKHESSGENDRKKRMETELKGEKMLKRNSRCLTMMEAKEKTWNMLKSSATVPGNLSRCESNSTRTSSNENKTGDKDTVSRKLDIRDRVDLAGRSKSGGKCLLSPLSCPSGLCDRAGRAAGPLTIFGLTQKQRRDLRCSWYRIRGNGGLQFAERILQSMLDTTPPVKDIFYKAAFLSAFKQTSGIAAFCKRSSSSITTCRDHAWIVLRMLDLLILDGCEDTKGDTYQYAMGQLRQFGAQHAFLAKSAGMRSEMWEVFGEVAVDTVRRYDCMRSNTETSRAWRILFASITDELRQGYDKELQKK